MTPHPTPPEFPKDEGAHPGIKSEWWYLFGFLSVEGEERYSFFGSLSDAPNGLDARFNIPFPNIGGCTFLEAGFTDLKERTHEPVYLLNNYPPAIIGPPVLHPGLHVGELNESFTHEQWSWSIKRTAPDTVQVNAHVSWGTLALTMKQERPPLLVGGNGVIKMGPYGLSSYYSMTRFAAEGTLTRNGKTEKVSGPVWHDHQWGDMELFHGYEGWTWLGLNLDDGTDWNIFRFHQKDERPVLVNADVMLADGTQHHLPEDLDIMNPDGDGWWRSPKTGIWFPLIWRVHSPQHGLDVTVRAMVDNQEMVGSWPYESGLALVPTFYEGAVMVEGTRNGAPVKGRGYLEMFGGQRD